MAENIIGQQVRAARYRQWPKLTQVELAELLCREGIDVNQAQISKIEHGSRQVFDFEVLALAKVLDVSASWLLGETSNSLRPRPPVQAPPAPEPEPDLATLITSYSPPVQKLFYVGEHQKRREYDRFGWGKPNPPWPDFPGQFGLTPQHIPELVHLATHPHYAHDAEEPEESAWIHAWVALAELGDASVITPLMDDFVAKEEDWAIVVEEDIMCIFSLFGAKAVEPLGEVFKRHKVESYPTILAIRCLKQLGLEHEETKESCIEILAGQLKHYKRQDEDYNGCVAEAMLELKALKYEKLIREAFKARKLSDFYIGGKESLDRVFKPKKFYHQDDRIALAGYNAVPAKRQPRQILYPVVPDSLPVRPEPFMPYDLPFDVELNGRDDPGRETLNRELWEIVPAKRQYNYAPPVNQLLHLGPEAIGVKMKHWPDYRGMGISDEHIPELIRMATDLRLLAEDDDTLEGSAVPHSWYALGILQAEAGVDPLIKMLRRQRYQDLIQENVPFVLGLIGAAAIPALEDFCRNYRLKDSDFDSVLYSVEESLYWIARRHPDSQERCVTILIEQLKNYEKRDSALTRFLMRSLIHLRATAALPLLEQAVKHLSEEDVSRTGDWFHIQYLFGLLSAEEADLQRLEYWRRRDLKRYGYPAEQSILISEHSAGYKAYTWLDHGRDFDKRGNVDRAFLKTRAARWAYKLTQGWFYGPFVVMALARANTTPESPIAGIAITDEKGNVLVETFINPGVPIAPEMTAQHGITDAMVASAPSFTEAHPAILNAIRNRKLVVYEALDKTLFSKQCSVHKLEDVRWGYHEVVNDYAYYRGLLNEKRTACIKQQLEAACQQQNVPVQPGLVGQCRMILGVIQAMANWLAEHALPETQPTDDEEEYRNYDDRPASMYISTWRKRDDPPSYKSLPKRSGLS